MYVGNANRTLVNIRIFIHSLKQFTKVTEATNSRPYQENINSPKHQGMDYLKKVL